MKRLTYVSVAAAVMAFGLAASAQSGAELKFDSTVNLINLPAVLLILGLTMLLVRGVQESATVNNVIVGIKMVIARWGADYPDPDNLAKAFADYDMKQLAYRNSWDNPVKDLVRKAHVGLAPGIAFGEECEGYLRLCFAKSGETLTSAMDRLEGFIASTVFASVRRSSMLRMKVAAVMTSNPEARMPSASFSVAMASSFMSQRNPLSPR